MSEKYTELAKAVSSARAKAAAIGPQHALWDVIMDAEALMAGRQTLVQGSEDERAETLTRALNRP
jgi:uncharacterized protein (DUF2236 family)